MRHEENQSQFSQWRASWRIFRKHRVAVFGLVVVSLFFLVAIFGPWISPHDPNEQSIRKSLNPPSAEHLLGTDLYGRDIFSRVIAGARISLSVAFVAVFIQITIGVGIGVLAGYFNALDGPLMRFVDVMMAVPSMVLLLTVVALFGAGIFNTMIVIGFTAWMSTARLVRGQFLSLREREFSEAARALGVRSMRIIWRHLMPNCLNVVIVQATLFISYAILTESTLSYLGLGVQAPHASWGNMLSAGRDYMQRAWWHTVFPGAAIFLAVLSFNFVGDGLRDALDPRTIIQEDKTS